MNKKFYKYEKIIVLTDPIGPGSRYVEYARKMSFGIVNLFTLDKELLEKFNIPLEQKDIEGEENIYEHNLNVILKQLLPIKDKIVGVIPCTEPGVELACYLAAALELPCNAPNIIKLTRNKYLMRKCLNKGQLAVPNYSICKNSVDINLFLKNNNFPIVIKTPEGAGSDHVFFCKTRQELEEKMDIILKNKNLFGMHTPYALLESFIQGEEYVFDLFADGNSNVYITNIFRYEKIINPLGGFAYKTAVLQDVQHSFFYNTRCYLEKVVKAIGITRGSIHCEVMLDSEGKNPILIELGARIPGAGFAHIVSKCSDFNPFIENIKVFSDTNYAWEIESLHPLKQGAIVFAPHQKKGILKKLMGLEEIIGLSSYYHHKIHKKPGDLVVPTTNLQNNIAIFWLIHKDKKQLLQDVEQTHTLFDIEVA